MNRTKSVIGVLLIFLVCSCVGFLGGVYYVKYMGSKFGPSKLNVEDRSIPLIKKLTQRLDLTEDQQYNIEKIIHKSEQETFDVRRNYLPEIEAITERTLLLIQQELNTEQIQKIDDFFQYVRDLHAKAAAELILSKKSTANKILNIKSLLNLTPKQEKKVQEIIEEYEIERQKIINDFNTGNNSKSPLQSQNERFPLFEKIIYLLDTSTEERLAVVLSKEQLKIYMKDQN